MQKKVRWKSAAGLFFVRNSDVKKVKGLNLLYHAFIMVIVYHAYLQNVCILPFTPADKVSEIQLYTQFILRY